MNLSGLVSNIVVVVVVVGMIINTLVRLTLAN